MKFKNCFEAVSEAMAVHYPERLKSRVSEIVYFCSLVDKLSEDSWADELAVVVDNDGHMSMSVGCVSVAASDGGHPLFALMRLSGSVGFEPCDNGNIWVHLPLPQEWFEV